MGKGFFGRSEVYVKSKKRIGGIGEPGLSHPSKSPAGRKRMHKREFQGGDNP